MPLLKLRTEAELRWDARELLLRRRVDALLVRCGNTTAFLLLDITTADATSLLVLGIVAVTSTGTSAERPLTRVPDALFICRGRTKTA